MLRIILSLAAICSAVQGSGFGPAAVSAPIVASTSSQFFERIYNRLVEAVPALRPVLPVATSPPVVLPPVPVQPVTNQVPLSVPTQSASNDPNVAIAIATAHAAAPVATILLPPFPFGPPPGFEFIQSPVYLPDESKPEETTATMTTQKEVTTVKQPEPTTQVPSNSDNNFVQALPSNENEVKFKQYYAPPIPTQGKPQKLKTTVEVVSVPLEYIAPPPLKQQAYKTVVKHYHKIVPAKIVIRPVTVRTIRVPARIIIHSAPVRKYIPKKTKASIYKQNIARSANLREREQTTFRPLNRPNIKPPRL